jgi:hypothetical protein
LEVCSPEECADAGLLPAAVMVGGSAQVEDDGNTISFEWTGQFYDLVYDENDNLVACNPTSEEQHSFSVTRTVFGPGIP